MTIKELCNEYKRCEDCAFNLVCCSNNSFYHLMTVNEKFNMDASKAIIETAKMLESNREVHNND